MKRTQSKAVKPARKGAVKKYHAIKGRTLLRETDQFRRLPDFPEWEPLGRKPLAGETCETWDGLRFKWRRRNPRAARANKGRNL